MIHVVFTLFSVLNFSPENVSFWVRSANIQHPEIVLNQAKLETGNFGCANCSMDYNNIFGFHNGTDYLKFPHPLSCVMFYKAWQDKYYDDGRDYYEFLDAVGYASATNYISTLKSMEDVH